MDAPRLMCHRDWRGIARAARASSVRFPRSTWVQLYAARAALYGGRPLEARATLRRLDPDRDLGWLEPPRAEYWEARALAEHALGDTAAESAVVRAFARSAPGTMAAATLEVRALAARGRDSAVFARLDAADGEHAEAEHDAGSLAYVAAMEFVAHGRDGAARAAAERALASFRARARVGRFDWTATRWGIERSLELLGRYDEATRWARELAAHDTAAVEYRATLGVLAARRGDRAEAARMDAWLAGRTSPYERADATLGRMEIAAALGERERTLGLLREAISQGYQPFFPDHFHVVRRTTLRGDPEYEALVRPRG
jgi:tetratricopeptide (TPR) repeat protein